MARLKKLTVVILIVIAIICPAIVLKGETILENKLAWPMRVVKVCIFNDQKNPATESVIRATLREAFRQYEKEVGIVFKPVGEILPYNGPISLLLLSVAPEKYAKALCDLSPEEAEIGIVFSNRQEVGEYEINGVKQILPTTGLASPHYGLIILYDADQRFYHHKNKSGAPQAVHALLHELAHLFNVDILEHTSDKNSFMYIPVSESYGLWTRDIIKIIKKNFYIKWYPRNGVLERA